jgi:hypothetical protein
VTLRKGGSIMIDTPVADGTRQSLTALPPGEPTLSELISGIADDAQHLIRQQYQMLRAEVREDIRRTKSAVQYLGLGIAGMVIGSLFLLIAVPFFLNWLFGLPPFAGWAIIGGAALILGIIGFFAGKRIFAHNNPLPDKTLHALEENLSWITKHRN